VKGTARPSWSGRRPARAWLGAFLVASFAMWACSIETAGAPTGAVDLVVHFDDVQDLTPGHNVQASNVVVGSVRDIRLDGYQAEVEISIVDDFRVPAGTEAMVRRTSLLGEYYVDLVLPVGFDATEGPFLADGDEIERSSTQPDVEQLAEQAAAVVGSLTADDLGATIEAAAIGLNGRGPALNRLVRDAGLVAAALADQSGDLARTVDGLGELGRTLGARADDLGGTIERLATATATVSENRERMVEALDALVALATATNDTVIEPHAERLATLLAELRPMLSTLVDRGDVLVDLLVDLDRFVQLFPTAVHNGNVLLLTWAHIPSALRDVGGTLDGLGLGALSDLLQQLGLYPEGTP